MILSLNCKLPNGEVEQYHLLNNSTYRCGKGNNVDIHIPDDMVSRHHVNFHIESGDVFIEDFNSTNGVWVGGVKIEASIKHPVQLNDQINIGDSELQFHQQKPKDDPIVEPVVKAEPIVEISPEPVQKPKKSMFGITKNKTVEPEPEVVSVTTNPVSSSTIDQAHFDYIKVIHEETLGYLDLHKRSVLHKLSSDELRTEAEKAVGEVLKSTKAQQPSDIRQDVLIESVVAEAVGLGPLEPMLADESITEIMVNGFDQIYVERSGKLERLPLRFNSNASLMSIIERIVAPLGRRIDEGSPMVDARLKDGSRVNAIIPPLALVGPTLTIRKFAKYRYEMDDLLKFNTLSEDMAAFLEQAVKHHCNVVVSGGTGSGKTTTLNVLSNFIPSTERIVTIEDAAELQLNQDHVISLESRPKNVEGKGEVLIRDLVKNSLRMRPDRIVVGECRGGEALDMLQAMNTGHDGSLTTGHANSPRDLLSRLEVMVLMSGVDLPVRAIREQIASAVDIILQQTRFSDGSRRVTSIFAVEGMEGDVVLLQKLFEYNQTGLSAEGKVVGEYVATGQIPTFYLELEKGGVKMDRSIFLRNNNSQI